MSQTQGGDANTQTNGQQTPPPRRASGKKAAPKTAAAPIAEPGAKVRKKRTKAQIAISTEKMRATLAAKKLPGANGTQAPTTTAKPPGTKPAVTVTGITMPIGQAAAWLQNAMTVGLKGNVTISAAA